MSKDMLKNLIDVVDEREIDTIFRILIRFIKEEAILPDEAESYVAACRDREKGNIFSHEEVWA